jgi:hypothetical protein
MNKLLQPAIASLLKCRVLVTRPKLLRTQLRVPSLVPRSDKEKVAEKAFWLSQRRNDNTRARDSPSYPPLMNLLSPSSVAALPPPPSNT